MTALAMDRPGLALVMAGLAERLACAVFWGFLSVTGIVELYLMKSALGINLMPGPSPLHDLFYHWVR